ncbi:MAG: rod shape-determining protein RodA [Pseudomonadota bacterium]
MTYIHDAERQSGRRYANTQASMSFMGSSGLGGLSWGLVALLTMTALIGTAMLYSTTQAGSGAEADLWQRHLTRFGIGLVAMISLALVPLPIWFRLSYIVYFGALVLLVAVEFAGSVRGGAQRWLEIGPIAIQPSEPMKVALTLALARYYHSALAKVPTDAVRHHLVAAMIILVPAALIFMQPDFGTTLALVASGGVIVFLSGLRKEIIGAFALLGIVSVPLIYTFVLADYQKERVDTFITQLSGGDESQSLSEGYQIEQARIAIGSGGLTGKGYMQGTQTKLEYIPEQHTDFILTVIAEELGFVGAAGLMLIWAAILVWCLLIAGRCSERFGRFAAAGVAATLGFYIVFNVGMVIGLLPVVGVPMPLVSYGGTAMMTIMVAFGLILSADLHRDSRMPEGGLL